MSVLHAGAIKIREERVFIPVRRIGPRTVEVNLQDQGDPLVTGLVIDQSRGFIEGEAELATGERIKLEIGMLTRNSAYLVPVEFHHDLEGINFGCDSTGIASVQIVGR